MNRRFLKCVYVAVFSATVFASAIGYAQSSDVGSAKPESHKSAVSFSRDVFSILQRSCIECHGPEKQEGDLRLDQRQAMLDSETVVKGDPDKSELIRRITLLRGHDEIMPAVGEPLSAAQIQILRQWISDGAVWPEDFVAAKHWAYEFPARTELPPSENDPWSRSPLDQFVLRRMKESGLQRSPVAEPETLVRRVYFDLIGLPPSPSEVEAFVRDPSDSRYPQLVDDLLHRPQFGEKWARSWLDLARYSDSHGFQRDDLRDNWAWRDWVIRALNDDMPFDQFTIEQIAGDLLPNAAESQKVATGFHRCAATNCEAGSLPEETRAEQLIDRVNTTATVWLGTTLECAQCHDHKFDPFTQADYYRLLAFFNNTAIEADRTNPKQPSSIAFQGPSMAISNPERDHQRELLNEKLHELEASVNSRREVLGSGLEDWSKDVVGQTSEAPVIHPVDVTEFSSLGNSDAYEKLAEGSILLVGNDPPAKDVYTVTAKANLKNIRAFRIDALTHESLPGMGPGRGDQQRTNYVLNEFTASVSNDSGQTQRALKFVSAKADFSQTKWDAFGAVDGRPETGWAIAPQFSQPHWAMFVLAEPLDVSENDQLTFTLHQDYGNARTLGCFRISAVTGNVDRDDSTGVSGEIADILNRDKASWPPKDRKRLVDFRVESDSATQKLNQQIVAVKKDIEKRTPDTTLVMIEQNLPRPAYVFERGDYRQQGVEVQPGTPSILHPMPAGPPNRLTLAKWLVDPSNPLVARVTVNRWWAEIFGQGLVTTPEDFGIKGEQPSHPEMLDWLAVEFMEHNWSMKHVLKTIVQSSTYRQSSRIRPKLAEVDDQNRQLARGPRFRLDAETIRDNALAVSGLLDLKQFGAPIRPVQPDGLWAKVGGQQYDYVVSAGTERYRRGIYIVLKRSAPYPSLVNFDASARLTCTVKRSRTNTPLQALTLLNDPVYVEASRALARRVLAKKTSKDVESQLSFAFQLCTSRTPTKEEREILNRLFDAQSLAFELRPEDAKRIVGDAAAELEMKNHELAAWYSVAAVLLNLHETITKP
jgi:mono/diheme cytochrome c family protein